MNLAQCLQNHLASWAAVLPQRRSLDRTIALGMGILCGVGKRTITRAIGFHGNTHKDWSADYKMFSRSPWEPRDLFAPILQEAIGQHRLERVVLSVDDPRVWRTGKDVPFTQWHRVVCLEQFSRQTDGTLGVVSNCAIFDSNFISHDNLLRLKTNKIPRR